jgi:hypothetical protein
MLWLASWLPLAAEGILDDVGASGTSRWDFQSGTRCQVIFLIGYLGLSFSWVHDVRSPAPCMPGHPDPFKGLSSNLK